MSAFCLCTVHTPKARRVNSGPSPIFTRRSYEPAPSPGQLRVGEDLPAALGVFTQLDAVFGARRQSNDSAAERRAQARPIHSLVRQPLPSAATLGPSASKEVGNVQGCCPPVEVLIIEQAPLHLEDSKDVTPLAIGNFVPQPVPY